MDNEKEYHSLQILQRGDQVGLQSFFTGTSDQCKIKAVDSCKTLSVSRNDFIELLEEFPAEYEQFCQLKD